VTTAGRRGGGSVAGRRRTRRRDPGRPAGESWTREAIVEAARAQFADHGYRGATIRGIAAAAAVDPALVHHYYGTKEALFAAAMRLPVVPSEVLAAALSGGRSATGPAEPGIGAQLVRTALTMWESAELKDTFLGLLRSAVTNEQASLMLREFISETILATMARVAGPDGHAPPAEADYRAAMVATQMLGLGLARLVFRLPAVVGASVDELAATVGPAVERYLTGEIELPGSAGGRPPVRQE
jgi:AcrR family transcriptional regulator